MEGHATLTEVYANFQTFFDHLDEFLRRLEGFETQSDKILNQLANHLEQAQVCQRLPRGTLAIDKESPDLRTRLVGKINAKALGHYLSLENQIEHIELSKVLTAQRELCLSRLHLLQDKSSLMALSAAWSSKPRVDLVLSWMRIGQDLVDSFERSVKESLKSVCEFCVDSDPSAQRGRTLQEVIKTANVSFTMIPESKEQLQDIVHLTRHPTPVAK